jgi:hypothetical protein
MTSTRQIQIAHRMHTLLRRELGEGIRVKQFLADPLYARDVLLVCDALPELGLDELAREFRALAQQPHSANDSTPPPGWAMEGPVPARPGWLSPRRWMRR